MYEEKAAALEAKQMLNKVQVQGNKEQLKLFRNIEGTVARVPLKDSDYRLRLLEAQKNRNQTTNDIKSLEAEENVIINELKQVKSEWHAFVEERNGKLLEEEVQLRNECEKISEEINKAKRLHELVSLKAPEHGVVLSLAERSVGSILQQAEPFITIVPLDSIIEVEVDIKAMDIARIRQGDSTRIKLDAFPFQRHDTLPGEVRVISENSFQSARPEAGADSSQVESSGAVYRARITILSTQLRDVPEGFRLMPGMKVRAEIKVGKRSIITYFLYPIVRAFDESLRDRATARSVIYL